LREIERDQGIRLLIEMNQSIKSMDRRERSDIDE